MTTVQKVNKTQAVVAYLTDHPDAANKEVAEALAGQGISITADYVARIRSKANGNGKAAKTAIVKLTAKTSQEEPAKVNNSVQKDTPAPEPAAEKKSKTASDTKIGHYLSTFDKPNRLQAFIGIEQHLGRELSDAEYWHFLGQVYQDTECLYPHRVVLDVLLGSARPNRESIMDANERRALAVLPDEFPVYRGHIGRNARGWSWTLDLNKARWFAGQFPPSLQGIRPKVTSGIVKKADVVALFLGRDELEIVVSPNRVRKTKTSDVGAH